MKYRIKNEVVEKAVRGLFKTQEAYENRLDEGCKNQLDTDWNRDCDTIHITIYNTESVTGDKCVVTLKKYDIEEVVEYDPRKWNPYPQFKPPKEGWYRVEHEYKGVMFHRAMYWEGKNWLGLPLEKSNPRFKPWDDEESKE